MNSIEYVEDILPDGLLQIPPALLRHTMLMEETKSTGSNVNLIRYQHSIHLHNSGSRFLRLQRF